VTLHVFPDNARYRQPKLLRQRPEQNGRRIKLHFVPDYRPQLDP